MITRRTVPFLKVYHAKMDPENGLLNVPPRSAPGRSLDLKNLSFAEYGASPKGEEIILLRHASFHLFFRKARMFFNEISEKEDQDAGRRIATGNELVR